MELHQAKKRIRKIMATFILSLILCAGTATTFGTALAQDAGTPAPAPAAEPAEEGSCESIDRPNPDSPYIVTTVIEEEFGSANENSDAGILVKTCFRETTVAATGSTSTYVGSCTPSGTGEQKAGDIICQRVQVIFSKTGSALLFGYISMIYKWGAGTVGIVSVFYLIWGGIQVSMSGDNTGSIDEAKKKIFQSIAGLVLLFLSAIILYTINPNFFTT
jgi:hypothetical protein